MNQGQPGQDLASEAAGAPGLPGFAAAPAQPAQPAAGAAGYRVLARKYRPRNFDDLIGQEAMVRTLSNAFETGRIPQAWMLTGVRGVGKTTTARILARGLNYETPDGGGAPTIHLTQPGVHCQQIIDGSHIDVMEIDAASNNGVDNIRQLNDSVRYAPVSARYKVYIVDEVHMLSTGAFNAFLKTLEEPPPHAKFIFATTEIRKVPVTILSRCQRFDLRRVQAPVLAAHLARICDAEKVTAENEALAQIARAAEGSVRDSLSLLDQAIAHGAGHVSGETVRAMLGLADRGRIIDLFEAVMRGDLPASLGQLQEQYDAGADPAVVMSELASFTHLVTRLKLVADAAKDPSLTEAERTRGADLAGKLSLRALSRAWQMLLKALPEVQDSFRPLAAAEMALVRLAYASDLPTPDEALRMLRDSAPSGGSGPALGGGQSGGPGLTPGGGAPQAMAHAVGQTASFAGGDREGGFGGGAPRAMSTALASGAMQLVSSQPAPAVAAQAGPAPKAAPAVRIARFEDLVALAGDKRDIGLKVALERDVRLVRFEDGVIEFALAENGGRHLASELSGRLQEWTGRRWVVAISSQPGEDTIQQRRATAKAERHSDAAAHPLVRAVLDRFPGAQIVDVIDVRPTGEEEDGGAAEAPYADDGDSAGEFED
ncbi:DNA polymerase III subunit gamma/tau [Camelimonas sp. ID_303_24]